MLVCCRCLGIIRAAGLGWGAWVFSARENQALATRTGDGQSAHQEWIWTSDRDCPRRWSCIFSCNRQTHTYKGTSTCWVPPAHRPIAIAITFTAWNDLQIPSPLPLHPRCGAIICWDASPALFQTSSPRVTTHPDQSSYLSGRPLITWQNYLRFLLMKIPSHVKIDSRFKTISHRVHARGCQT